MKLRVYLFGLFQLEIHATQSIYKFKKFKNICLIPLDELVYVIMESWDISLWHINFCLLKFTFSKTDMEHKVKQGKSETYDNELSNI